VGNEEERLERKERRRRRWEQRERRKRRKKRKVSKETGTRGEGNDQEEDEVGTVTAERKEQLMEGQGREWIFKRRGEGKKVGEDEGKGIEREGWKEERGRR
jgi:hypothetical protein